MTLEKQQKWLISTVLFTLYLIPALHDWFKVGLPLDLVLIKSAPVWLTFFYIGPFWLYYWLSEVSFVGKLPVVVQGIGFVSLMMLGTELVQQGHILLFGDYHFPLFEQFFSALLWGIFIFSMWQMYLLYARFNREKQMRKDAQMASLTSRLNPHFLFNSLNTVSALMYKSVNDADQVLQQLADILRYSIDQHDQLVTLEQELAVNKDYLAIEQVRFSDKLTVDWQISPQVEQHASAIKVPPLLIQPLVENTLKHGQSFPLFIVISITIKQNQLQITVQDNGCGFSLQVLKQQFGKGHGLHISKQRVELMGGEFKLTNNGGALCQILLPIQSFD